MKSPVFEQLFLRIRTFGPNITLVPMADAVRYYVKNRNHDRKVVLGLISDQSPILRADTEWIEFLNQPTAFIDGGARLGVRFGLPVYFSYTKRIKADRYEIKFVELYDGKQKVEPIEIVRRYAQHMEAMIRECPELWMWSHNRWKHTPEKQERKFGVKREILK
jgi:KDO2-lipid IV(A) lauroyltransferase